MKHEERSFSNDEIDKFIGRGGNFRKLKTDKAAVWLGLMLGGKWVQPHPSPIILSHDGRRCIDGQHRLSAARQYNAKTGKKIVFSVAYINPGKSVEVAVSLSLDAGDKRTIGHWLDFFKVKNVTIVGSVLRFITTFGGEPSETAFNSANKCTPAMMVEAYEADCDNITSAVNLARHAGQSAGFGNCGLLACVAYLIAKKNRSGCDRFFDLLASGEGLNATSPILALRNLLIRNRSEWSKKSVPRRAVIAALTIKAWNAWANGEQVKLLKWTTNGATAEAFPKISSGDPSLFE